MVEDGLRLINFQLYRTLSEKITDMLQYQDTLRSQDSNLISPELKSYLEKRIATTPLDAKSKAALEARSLELRTLEAEISFLRKDELRNAGFQ